jgi:hypothetical protein
MSCLRLHAVLAAALALVACAMPVAADGAGPAATDGAAPYMAVLVAGDDSLPVFDNAVDGVTALLRRTGAAADVTRLSATPGAAARGAREASLDGVLRAVGALRPAPGQACLVYATSHGVSGRGLYLAAAEEVLTPAMLDRALNAGCGAAPTVVVVSSCFSGLFSQGAMTRPNRVILTAARADRTSFGCGAGRTYTVYDRCLLEHLEERGGWPQVHAALRRCVAAEERRERVDASLPQAWFGGRAARLRALGMEPTAP